MSEKLSEDSISTYYRTKFSLKHLLTVIGAKDFPYREFGFLLGEAKRDFVRNLSFSSPRDLKNYLIENAPRAAYVGAAYEQRPTKNRPITALSLKKRELVFDLDLTDWNDVRSCGTGKTHYCKECWPYVRNAAKFIDKTLREDFNFDSIRWFFSGRRGLHGWVLGEKSQMLSKSAREAIVSYLSPKSRVSLSHRFQLRVSKICHEGGISEIDDVYEHLPRIDRKVTIDMHRLMRVPGSLHQATGRPVTPVQDLEGFYPDAVLPVWEIL